VKDAEVIRRVLEEEREQLRARLAEMTAAPRDPMASVSFGKRVGEGTTQAVERLNQVGTAKQLSAMLEDVERALEKLGEGTYGVCDSCGTEIPRERLEARRWSVLCVACSARKAG
jgi:DnaK suppressor protein